MMYVPLSDVPREIIANFWSSGEISERTRQKGLQYAFEGYIHDICAKSDNGEINIEAKAYWSQLKTETPHLLLISANTGGIKEQQCSCTAG